MLASRILSNTGIAAHLGVAFWAVWAVRSVADDLASIGLQVMWPSGRCRILWQNKLVESNISYESEDQETEKTLGSQYTLTAPFNNMGTLKFKAQPTNAFFATVNRIFCGSSQLPTTAEHCFVVWTVPNDLITARSTLSSRKLGGAAEHLIDGSEKRICLLSFEFYESACY